MAPRSFNTSLAPTLLAICVLVASVVLVQGSALADGGTEFDVTGTWITDPLPAPPGTQYGQQIIMNIHADGTLHTSWSFENGAQGFYGNSLIHGVWTQTGPQEMASRELAFLYMQGQPRYVSRFSNTYTFSEDFKTFTLDFFEEVFLPDQDPTDPDEEPVNTYHFPLFHGRRLDAPVAGAYRGPQAHRDVNASGDGEPSASVAPDALNLRIIGSATGLPAVELALPEPSAVHLDIFDVTGRLVRSLRDEPLSAGIHTFVWDGRSTAGKSTASGVYLVKLQALDQTRTAKIVRNR